jgi:hypothetical protein
VPPPPLTSVPFSGLAAAAGLPARAGVGQILAADGRSLLIGRAANLRRWFATHLGGGRPTPGAARRAADAATSRTRRERPRLDLSPLAATLAYVETTSAFQQRLLFERLMAAHVPLAARRDLKVPAYLHLDPQERFPRVTVRPAGPGPLYGPFRDRRAAQRAREALHKRFPLRPCDYSFEPDPALPLGLGCVYAQVRSCAAPCLARVDEAGYRAIAARAAELLADPESRPDEVASWLPSWASGSAYALVVERGQAGLELYPVREGSVLDGGVASGSPDAVAETLAAVSWTAMAPAGDDRPWLCAWLNDPRRSGALLPVLDPEDRHSLAARAQRVLAASSRRRRGKAPSPA